MKLKELMRRGYTFNNVRILLGLTVPQLQDLIFRTFR